MGWSEILWLACFTSNDWSVWFRDVSEVFFFCLLLLSNSNSVVSWTSELLLSLMFVQAVGWKSVLLFIHTAHRYHQAKASGQGQGAQSKSSSAHSSRSTSPGPHWRNDGIAPYKPPDRRSLEPLNAPCASSSSTRPGRSQNPSVPTELDSAAARPLLPRPPRDRSEPRHINPLRWVCISARLISWYEINLSCYPAYSDVLFCPETCRQARTTHSQWREHTHNKCTCQETTDYTRADLSNLRWHCPEKSLSHNRSIAPSSGCKVDSKLHSIFCHWFNHTFYIPSWMGFCASCC